MSEPRRLLSSSSDASSLERALLGAGRQRREPEGMRDRVRLGVTAAVAAGAISATATTAKAATTAGSASVLAKAKIVLVAAALVSAAGATTYVATKAPPTAPAVAPPPMQPIASPPPSLSPSPPPPPPLPPPLPPPPSLPPPHPRASIPSQPKPVAPTVALSDLREEASLVDEARSALAQNDLVTATDRLARADARFPRGRLAEEREALAVRIASAGGDAPRAARLARTFLARHPTSPLRPSMEAIAKKSEIE